MYGRSWIIIRSCSIRQVIVTPAESTRLQPAAGLVDRSFVTGYEGKEGILFEKRPAAISSGWKADIIVRLVTARQCRRIG